MGAPRKFEVEDRVRLRYHTGNCKLTALPGNPTSRSRRRKALSQVGGRVRRRGDAEAAELLERAMTAAEAESATSSTHGFHSYPARMHPGIANVLLDELGHRGGSVLDPFCGSGTVLVSAMVAGMDGTGVDLNPLALRVAEVKTMVLGRRARRTFRAKLTQVANASLERVRRRARAIAPIPQAEVGWYEAHVLKEMAGLWAEIEKVESNRDRRAMEMVFSAIVVKFSRQQAETSSKRVATRVPKGLVSRFFERKGRELVSQWEALSKAVPHGTRAPVLLEGDARSLPELAKSKHYDLIVSSPPYGGTYDYIEHHARRYPWLRLDLRPMKRAELGARRHLRGRQGLRRWEREVGSMLRAMRAVLRPRGRCVLLMGDGEIAGSRIAADRQLRTLAGPAGFSVVASASQTRRDWKGGAPRKEHLVLLTSD